MQLPCLWPLPNMWKVPTKLDWFFGNRKEGFFFPSIFFWGGGHNHSCKAVPLDFRVNYEDQTFVINTEV